MQNLTVERTFPNAGQLLEGIKQRRWWQGSVIAARSLDFVQDEHRDVEYWVIASQACNLYNPDFAKIPVFELVGADLVETLNPALTRGDNPRTIHLLADKNDGSVGLSLDIQKRRWLPREILAEIQSPVATIHDGEYGAGGMSQYRWLDNLAGWLGRSYTRVALPDAFNDAIKLSRIKDAFDKILREHHNLYGIYFIVDSDEEWEGRLGEMPPPYNLGVMLITHDFVDDGKIRDDFIQKAFKDKIKDPANETLKITRADLARRYDVRLVEIGVELRSVSEVTLSDLSGMIRYSLVDHLSDSTMAVQK